VSGRITILLAAVALVLLSTSDALAWGPATHIKLGSDLLSQSGILSAGLASLLVKHRRAFLYGNVATDTVFAKKMSRVKQICHHWSTGFGLLNAARTDEGRAFAYGYLSHLAADTVAHNKFLPRQMAVAQSTITFGHLYWEIRADSPIPRPHWVRLRNLLTNEPGEAAELLRASLTNTLLSFRTNQVIFRRMNLMASLQTWRRSVEFWSKLSRHQLDTMVLKSYHDESLSRMVDVLNRGEQSSVLHFDPNGNAALDYAKAQRRYMRYTRRARLPNRHVIDEASIGHAPDHDSMRSA